MSLTLSIQDLMSVGAHFGHSIRRRNPKMIPFIHSERAKIHILDLEQTLPLFVKALNRMQDIVAKGGRILFVGTKRQASETIIEQALRCGQHYVAKRWLGGLLTNWTTISEAIRRMKRLEADFETEKFQAIPKKEQLQIRREHEKLERSLGGIKNMGQLPDAIFVIDINREHIAVSEAKKLGIPIIALVDTNCDPSGITFPIPANDDALKAIQYFSYWVSEAVLKGLEQEASRTESLLKKKAGAAEKAGINASAQENQEQASPEEGAQPSDKPTVVKVERKTRKSKEIQATVTTTSDSTDSKEKQPAHIDGQEKLSAIKKETETNTPQTLNTSPVSPPQATTGKES